MKQTELEQLTGITYTRPKLKDLGTEISAEMYYNYSSSGSCSYSDSTLQQSTGPSDLIYESVIAPKALFPSSSPSGLAVEETKNTGNTGKTNQAPNLHKNIPRKISTQDYYVQINISVNEIRRGTRTDRMNAYISVRDENDKKFTIYMRSSLTTAIDETNRSIRKTDNKVLEKNLLEIGSACPNNAKLFTGRIRYNPRRYKIESEHKTNLKSALIGIYDYGSSMTAVLYMFDEPYVIELSNDLTTKQQGTFDYTGSWARDIEEEK